LDNLLPIEDTEVSVMLKKVFDRRKIDVRTKTKTEKAERVGDSVRLTLSGEKPGTVDADVVLVAVGVTGNLEGLGAAESKLEVVKNRIKVDSHYRTNLENVWAIGDCVAIDGNRHPDLAHVAHHEAVGLIEHIR